MQSYRELTVWQKAMDLTEEAYRLTKRLPREEHYALSDQIKRAVVSIPSNIAEGFGRNSTGDYVRFLNIAKGSKNEVETQFLLCVRLGYLREQDIIEIMSLCNEVGKMLNTIVKKLGSRS